MMSPVAMFFGIILLLAFFRAEPMLQYKESPIQEIHDALFAKGRRPITY